MTEHSLNISYEKIFKKMQKDAGNFWSLENSDLNFYGKYLSEMNL